MTKPALLAACLLPTPPCGALAQTENHPTRPILIHELITWHGLPAPRGTPRAIVTMLNERIRKVMIAPDETKRLEDRGLDIIAGTPEEFIAHLANELGKWGTVVKERGMRAN